MNTNTSTFSSVGEMLRSLQPARPVYCIYPQVYLQTARDFVAGFSGRVLYAVKANDHPSVIGILRQAGVKHFDCASLSEIEKVKQVSPDSSCYFMTPVRRRGAAREAQSRYGVRHFMLDHLSGLGALADEIDMNSAVVFVRMAVHHPAALQDLSSKFGAPPAEVPSLVSAIAETGAEAALAFNVGSAVTSADAYTHAIALAKDVLSNLATKIRLVDVGGGFAKPYPGFPVPPISDYIKVINSNAADLPLAEGGEIMCEPGRALAAPGMSAVVEILLRKDERLYLNDGMYGIFWELRFNGHDRYPVRCYRDGQEVVGETRLFKLYGPTCDSSDVLPGEVPLPASIRVGDHLEFGCIGAYSLTGRTDFNGHHSDVIVAINDAVPPSV
jgi:ornithine decarboxylase